MNGLPAAPAASNTLLAPPTDERGGDPARLAGLLAVAWLEVRGGRRPLHQLRPLLTPAVDQRLAHQVARGRDRATNLTRIRRIHATRPSDDVCEAVVLLDHAGRTTAIAIRLERRAGRWRAADLSAPEAGLPPLASRRSATLVAQVVTPHGSA